jgi:hypothetical protein
MRNAYKILFEKPGGKRPLGTPVRTWGIMLNFILGKWSGSLWTGLIWLKTEISGGYF